jgi:hypothetical protein
MNGYLMSEKVTGNNRDGMDFIVIYCMCYAASLCITSSFYSSFTMLSRYEGTLNIDILTIYHLEYAQL